MGTVLRVKKLTDLAILPTRGSALAAGFDLASAYDAVIPAHGKGLVKTDLCIAVPDGCYARVAPRSGLALKKFIDTGAGVIDADYRGNVGVVLFNHADEAFEIKRGDRVAQLILEKIAYAEIQVVQEIEETARGAGGFGSTGIDLPLKRVRHEEFGTKQIDSVYTALQQLFASGAINDEQRLLVKTRVLNATDRQYAMLCQAMTDFLDSKQEIQAVEWIDAFLNATNSTTVQP